jgi:hypothetical protein
MAPDMLLLIFFVLLWIILQHLNRLWSILSPRSSCLQLLSGPGSGNIADVASSLGCGIKAGAVSRPRVKVAVPYNAIYVDCKRSAKGAGSRCVSSAYACMFGPRNG